MNADGSRRRHLAQASYRSDPAWSPDDRKIAFDRRLGKERLTDWGTAGSFDVYVMNADGSGQRRLAQNGSQPLWSPDGKKIAFSRPLGDGVKFGVRGNREIFVMNADGTQLRNVTRNRRWDDCCVAWSPAQR